MFEMMLGRVGGVLAGVRLVGVSQLCVMRSLMVVAGVMVLRGFGVVVRGQTMMMRRLAMFVRCLL